MLELGNTSDITSLPPLRRLRRLTHLSIHTIVYLPEIPDLGSLVHLKELELYHLPGIEELPDLNPLVNLQTLDLHVLPVRELPDLESLVNLQKLEITCYDRVWKLPDLPTNIQELVLYGTPIQTLPQNIGNLIQLRELHVDFHRLSRLPQSFQNLVYLETLNTGQGEDFGFPVPSYVLELPRLQKVEMSLQSIGNFESVDEYSGGLELWCSVRRQGVAADRVLEETRRLRDWKQLSQLNYWIYISGNIEPFPTSHFFGGVLGSLAKMKRLHLAVSDGRPSPVQMKPARLDLFLTSFTIQIIGKI